MSWTATRIYVDQTRLRLISMDAFEAARTCTRDGRSYSCDEEATGALIRLIGQRRSSARAPSGIGTGDRWSTSGSGTSIWDGLWWPKGGLWPNTAPSTGRIRKPLRRVAQGLGRALSRGRRTGVNSTFDRGVRLGGIE
jgi:hypothetical protein